MTTSLQQQHFILTTSKLPFLVTELNQGVQKNISRLSLLEVGREVYAEGFTQGLNFNVNPELSSLEVKLSWLANPGEPLPIFYYRQVKYYRPQENQPITDLLISFNGGVDWTSYKSPNAKTIFRRGDKIAGYNTDMFATFQNALSMGFVTVKTP